MNLIEREIVVRWSGIEFTNFSTRIENAFKVFVLFRTKFYCAKFSPLEQKDIVDYQDM